MTDEAHAVMLSQGLDMSGFWDMSWGEICRALALLSDRREGERKQTNMQAYNTAQLVAEFVADKFAKRPKKSRTFDQVFNQRDNTDWKTRRDRMIAWGERMKQATGR